MTNSSSVSERLGPALGAAVALALAAAGAALDPRFAVAGAALAGLGFAALALRPRRAAPVSADATAPAADAELRDVVARVTALLDGAFRGDLESRIQPTPEAEPGRALCVAANDFLDVSDAFVRESRVSIEMISEGRHHRRFLPRGLDGAHARAARTISASTERMGARVRGFNALTDAFESEVLKVARALDDSAEMLSGDARALTEAVETAGRDAGAIGERAEGSAADVAGAAETAGALGAALSAVAERTAAARALAERCAAEAEQGGKGAATLLAGAESIGKVVELIREVSEQINLLALNAMIEAVRSGAAGAGFAVVAREVQTLAHRTKEATAEIEGRVRETQRAASQVARTVEGVRGAIADLAVETAEADRETARQSEAVDEIARRVATVAAGAEDVSRLVVGVSAALSDACDRSGAVGREAGEVLLRARGLGGRLTGYLEQARAG